MIGGTVVGAAIGSSFGPVGTIIGAGIGLVAGTIAGAALESEERELRVSHVQMNNDEEL